MAQGYHNRYRRGCCPLRQNNDAERVAWAGYPAPTEVIDRPALLSEGWVVTKRLYGSEYDPTGCTNEHNVW